jgi:hypothetical protein
MLHQNSKVFNPALRRMCMHIHGRKIFTVEQQSNAVVDELPSSKGRVSYEKCRIAIIDLKANQMFANCGKG